MPSPDLPGPNGRTSRRRLLRGRFSAHLQYDLYELVRSFRFRTSVILVVGLMVISAFLYATRYKAEVRAYNDAVELYRAELAGSTVASLADTVHPALKPPWKLEFLADSGRARGYDAYRQTLSAWTDPELGTLLPTQERWPESTPLDWLFIIGVALSLEACLLGYDAVCGQGQRLRLILSYPFARTELLAAKLLALWTCLALPFLAGALLALPVLGLYGGLTFQAVELFKIALTVGLGLWAALLFAAAAILISISCRVAADSLAVAALVWVTAVVVLPAGAELTAQMLRPLPSERDVARQMQDIQRQILTAEEEAPRSWRRPELAAADDFAWERRSAKVENRRYMLQEALRRDLVRRQLAQVELARTLSTLSPTGLLQDVAQRLVGSGPYRDRRFLERAWAFRLVLAEHVRNLDGQDPRSPHILFFSEYLSKRPVKPEAVPRFTFPEVSPEEGWRAARGRLAGLVVWTLVPLGVAFVAFARWKER